MGPLSTTELPLGIVAAIGFRMKGRSEINWEKGHVGQLDLGDCMLLIDEAFEPVAAEYVDGALSILNTDRDIARRFGETEAAIDATVKAGPTEADLRAALAAHVEVIRECIREMERRR